MVVRVVLLLLLLLLLAAEHLVKEATELGSRQGWEEQRQESWEEELERSHSCVSSEGYLYEIDMVWRKYFLGNLFCESLAGCWS